MGSDETGMHGAAMPGSSASIYIHAVFDTGVIIDTFTMTSSDFANAATRTLAALQTLMPTADWGQEGADNILDLDLTDFVPLVNLSFVRAKYPQLLTQSELHYALPSGLQCRIAFGTPIVYLHAFGCGVLSLPALLDGSMGWTSSDMEAIEAEILRDLGPLVEQRLRALIAVFDQTVKTSNVPIYHPPVSADTRPMANRDLLYWSHRLFVIRPDDDAEIEAAAQRLAPLMRPSDQRGVWNMAIRPGRFIYFGSGRSLIVCSRSLPESALYSYVRLVEIRNYVWKALFDLDRSLRSALILRHDADSPRETRHIVRGLQGMELRANGVLEELDPSKLTFDTEKIWLVKHLDLNWLTADLVNSLHARLASLGSFYTYTEQATARDRDERLQWILNLIGIVATAGAITEIINYFDPRDHFPVVERDWLFLATMATTLILFYLAVLLSRRARRDG